MIEPKSGTIVPIMGTMTTDIGNALFSGAQQRVLALLFGQPERSFYAKELVRLAESGSGAVQRELARLAASGLVTVTNRGNQKHYQANQQSPVFAELHGLVVKTFGVVDVLRQALLPLADQIDMALLFGSVARNEATAQSDIDVLIVADDMGFPELIEALSPAETTLGRKINPVIYSNAELQCKQKEGNHFVTTVFSQPHVFILGKDNDTAGFRKSGKNKTVRLG